MDRATTAYEQMAAAYVHDLLKNQLDIVNTYGMTLYNQGQKQEAMEILQETVSIDPRFFDAQNNLGAVLTNEGLLTQAETHLRAAVALAPHAPSAHFNLGNCLLRQKRFAEAAREYEETLKFAPSYQPAQELLSKIRAMQRSAPR